MNFCPKNKSNLTCEALIYVCRYQLIGTLTRSHLAVRIVINTERLCSVLQPCLTPFVK